MVTESPGPAFIQMDPLDKSTLSAIANHDVTQYLKVTKLAIRQYLQECLRQEGQFRTFFDRVASYTIGYHVNEELPDDLHERHIQVAAYWEGMTERPPQIFIQDNGYEYKPASLGSLTAGWNMRTKDGHQLVRVMDVVPIPILIRCVALDVQEIEDLAAFLSVAFGQLNRFTLNYYLKPKTNQYGAYWEVRIPLTHSISAKSNTPVHGDPKLQFWSIDCSLTVDFENSIFMQYRSKPEVELSQNSMFFDTPSTIILGQDQPITLQYHPDPVGVYSNNAKVAGVRKSGNGWTIIPRRPGTFTLVVSRTVGNNSGPEILASKEITVKSR